MHALMKHARSASKNVEMMIAASTYALNVQQVARVATNPFVTNILLCVTGVKNNSVMVAEIVH